MGLISVDFRDQLYGPWESARSFLVEQLDRWAASLNASGTAASASASGVDTFRTGDVKVSASVAAQDGWLLCDGSLYSRTTHKRLFDVIGITYGAGDGSSTFAVPDVRQRVVLGLAAGGTGSVLGGTGGAIDHTHAVPALTVGGLPVSGSTGTGTTGTGTTSTQPDHTHSVGPQAFDVVGGFGGPNVSGTSAPLAVSVSLTTSANGNHNHTVPGLSVPSLSVTGTTTGGVTGAGTSSANNMAFMALPLFIKD